MFAIPTPVMRQSLPYYSAGVDAFETMLSVWSASFRTSADIAALWTRVWLKTPCAFGAWRADDVPAPDGAMETAVQAVEKVQMAAADVAEAVVGAMEEVAEIPLTVAEEVAAMAESEMAPEFDDLTRLVGVGPRLAAALAERGVTRFEHIAAWKDEDLAEIDKALDLKGRAVRDAWVAQARRFMGAEPAAPATPADAGQATTH